VNKFSRRRAGSWLILAVSVLGTTRFPTSARQNVTQAKENSPDLKAFVGTWKAIFNREVFAILILKEDRGSLSGTLNNFDLILDKDGNLADGTHKDEGDAPLLNTRFKSGAFWFVVMQKDQYFAATEWKFSPKSATEGELTPVVNYQVNVPGNTAVKPIRMVRRRAKN
jgi:hypothetical protein